MRTILFLSALLFAPVMAGAHADGLSFERKTGDILIDIGFGKELPATGVPITYSFDLFNVADPDAYLFEPFKEVDVRILKGQEELFGKTLQNNGTDVPALTYAFDEAGDYSMSVDYVRAGKESVSAAFGFRVTESEKPPVATTGVRLLAAIIGGLVVLLIIARVILLMRRKD